MRKLFMVLVFMILPLLSLQAASINVSWNANTESDLAGYKVYYGTAVDKMDSIVDVGNVTSYAFTVSPVVTTTYFAVLTAYDTSGNESVKSDVTSVTVVIADTTPPAKPTGFKAFLQKLAEWFKKKFRA